MMPGSFDAITISEEELMLLDHNFLYMGPKLIRESIHLLGLRKSG
jgi:hypothetical protein